MNLDSVLIISLILFSISAVALTVYLIIALVQVKKAGKELELALRKVNAELDLVNKVSDKVVSVTGKISSPVISAASIAFYVFSLMKSKKGRREE